MGEGGREFFELNKRFFKPKIRILLRAITGYDSAKQGDIFRPKKRGCEVVPFDERTRVLWQNASSMILSDSKTKV